MTILSGRQIDGPLSYMNYDDILAQMEGYKENWARYGVTVMCDSWIGLFKMCTINFMIFCNGCMLFHSFMNATDHFQNVAFIYEHIILRMSGCIHGIVEKHAAIANYHEFNDAGPIYESHITVTPYRAQFSLYSFI